MLHPAAVAGTNEDVLLEASKRDADGDCTPSATDLAVFQTNVVVSDDPPPKATTRKVAEIGMMTQS